jgi:lysophospholipase L1-like esterase
VASSRMRDFAIRIYLATFRILRVLRYGGRDMKAKSYTPCSAWRIALIAATLTVGACDAANEIANDGGDADVNYYVSVGTSLSVGVQPDSNGVTLPSGDGYADQLYDSIRPTFEAGGAQPRVLELVKLGCPGETLDDMINGGNCVYIAGSQLDAAVDFLNDNMGKIHLVTIDMGANDFSDAGCVTTTVDANCVNTVSAQIATDLTTVLTALRNAAGPNTPIVGMNYYNPFLASWLVDLAGQTLAMESVQASTVLNDFLSTTYTSAGMNMADVYTAFGSGDFTMVPSPLDPNVMLPLSVANICTFTYMCDPAPIGPDIHANVPGYSLIADTLAVEMP